MVETTIKAVITGDNHLNHYNQKLGAKLGERRGRIGAAWRKTIDYAIESKADLYLNTGDLFDQLSPRNPPRARVVEAFRDLQKAGVQAFIVAGNHEAPSSTRDGASPHTVLSEAGLATVFECYREFRQEKLTIQGAEVSIAGMSYDRALQSKADPLEGLTVPGGADVNIALLHYSIERIAPPLWDEPVIKLASIERNNHVHLYAMGHIHSHVDTMVHGSRVIYPGATEHLDFGEAGNTTGFCSVEVQGGQIKSEYIPIEAQPMRQLKIHTSTMNPADPNATVLSEVQKSSDPDGLLQLILEGETSFEQYTSLDFTKINNMGASQNFYFEYQDQIRPRVEGLTFTPGKGLSPRQELEKVAQKAMDEKKGRERDIWQQAADYALQYYLKARDE